MKAKSFQVSALTTQLQHSCDAVVLYGTDEGEIQYTFNQLKQRLISLDSQTNFVFLSKEALKKTPFLATDEANTLSLIAARRVLFISSDVPFSGPALAHFLDNKRTNALLIIDGGNLPKSNALRVLAENDPRVVAIACYQPTLKDIQKNVSGYLLAHHKTISADDLEVLCQKIPFNQQIIEQELEKLLLYLGTKTEVSLQAIQECLIDSAEASLTDLCIHLADGKVAEVQRDVALFLASDESEVFLFKAVRTYFETLLSIISEKSVAPERAIELHLKSAQFALKQPLMRQIRFWTPAAILDLLTKLTQLEQDTRTAALPKNTVISYGFLSFATTAKKLAGLR